jgi:hypothetical protein
MPDVSEMLLIEQDEIPDGGQITGRADTNAEAAGPAAVEVVSPYGPGQLVEEAGQVRGGQRER